MPAHRLDISGGVKTCPECGVEKPLDDFSRRGDRPLGRVSRCKKCVACRDKGRQRTSDWIVKKRKEDPLYSRRMNLSRYGISLEQYDEMLSRQGGVCAICEGPAMGKGAYHVDHDHKTGQVRGLLCHKCNVALGMVQDDCEHLRKLIAYLGELS